MFTSQHVRSIWNTWPVQTDRHWAASRRGKDTWSSPANSHGLEGLPKSSALVFSRLWKCFEGERRTTSQPWERIKQNAASWLWNLECPHFGHCPNFLFPSSDALTGQTKPDNGKNVRAYPKSLLCPLACNHFALSSITHGSALFIWVSLTLSTSTTIEAQLWNSYTVRLWVEQSVGRQGLLAVVLLKRILLKDEITHINEDTSAVGTK